jgi:hypothetical protein
MGNTIEYYRVIESHSVGDIIKIANLLMERGYKPAGGITKMPQTGFLTQSMFLEPMSIK